VANGLAPEGPVKFSEAYQVKGFMAKDPNGYMLEFQTLPVLSVK